MVRCICDILFDFPRGLEGRKITPLCIRSSPVREKVRCHKKHVDGKMQRKDTTIMRYTHSYPKNALLKFRTESSQCTDRFPSSLASTRSFPTSTTQQDENTLFSRGDSSLLLLHAIRHQRLLVVMFLRLALDAAATPILRIVVVDDGDELLGGGPIEHERKQVQIDRHNHKATPRNDVASRIGWA